MEGLSSSDPSSWVVLEHFHEQIEAIIIDFFGADQFSQVERAVLRPVDRLEFAHLTNARPLFLSGLSSHDAEDLLKLGFVAFTAEKHLIYGQLCKNAADRPDVYWSGILVHLQEQLRATVVESHHTLGVRLDGDGKGASETKVTDFDLFVLLSSQENILWLQVPVDDALRVAVGDRLKDLPQVTLYERLW